MLFIGNFGTGEIVILSAVFLFYFLKFMDPKLIAKGLIHLLDIIKIGALAFIGYYVWTYNKEMDLLRGIFFIFFGLSIFFIYNMIRKFL